MALWDLKHGCMRSMEKTFNFWTKKNRNCDRDKNRRPVLNRQKPTTCPEPEKNHSAGPETAESSEPVPSRQKSSTGPEPEKNPWTGPEPEKACDRSERVNGSVFLGQWADSRFRADGDSIAAVRESERKSTKAGPGRFSIGQRSKYVEFFLQIDWKFVEKN